MSELDFEVTYMRENDLSMKYGVGFTLESFHNLIPYIHRLVCEAPMNNRIKTINVNGQTVYTKTAGFIKDYQL